MHQTNQTLEEKILRHFDLSSQFGPCIGISRLERWKRAQRLGLAPPKEVLDVAVRMEVVERNVENLALKRDTRKAYIDDFLAGRGEE